MHLITKIQLFAKVKQALSQKLYGDSKITSMDGSDRQSQDSWLLLSTWLQRIGHTKIRSVSLGWIILAGFVFGIMTMTGLLSYSGSAPINLIYLLLVYGPLQWLLMVLALLSVSLQGKGLAVTRWLSGQKFLQTFPAFFYRWLLFWLNQWLSLSFLLGSLAAFLLLLVSQDLAFGWSTTIAFAPEHITDVLHILSTPWASWWPQATISPELVSGTQFFRLQGVQGNYDATLFGQWWTFILAFILTYNLLPRGLLLLLSQLMMITRVNALLYQDAEVFQLIDDLKPVVVETGSHRDAHYQTASEPKTRVSHGGYEPDAALLLWGLSAEDLKHLHLYERCQKAIQLTDHLDVSTQTKFTLMVPGWEPPIAELTDLLERFPAASVQLLLMPLGQQLDEADIASWQMFSDSLQQIERLSVWSDEEPVS
ncbi:DUF2868 domain-containing protein [Gynuella sp.]|uniref:DUF2868 domain-containing protein n=1 Tax=Gynuella sp. TaxID=2969146 RepID=UPI003D0FC866